MTEPATRRQREGLNPTGTYPRAHERGILRA
jgi:hypothetical protein